MNFSVVFQISENWSDNSFNPNQYTFCTSKVVSCVITDSCNVISIILHTWNQDTQIKWHCSFKLLIKLPFLELVVRTCCIKPHGLAVMTQVNLNVLLPDKGRNLVYVPTRWWSLWVCNQMQRHTFLLWFCEYRDSDS